MVKIPHGKNNPWRFFFKSTPFYCNPRTMPQTEKHPLQMLTSVRSTFGLDCGDRGNSRLCQQLFISLCHPNTKLIMYFDTCTNTCTGDSLCTACMCALIFNCLFSFHGQKTNEHSTTFGYQRCHDEWNGMSKSLFVPAYLPDYYRNE